jgi:hypothetical protein
MRTTSKLKSRLLLAGAFLLPLAIVVGCEDKGPMEKAGERVDNAAKSLDPRGPMEKAGAKLDDAVNP